jgi:hypothetical protein
MRQASLVRPLLYALTILLIPLFAQAQESARRVIHIDSYHAGNEWNDRIVAALQETLPTQKVELRVFHMDTKRRGSEADIRASAAAALKASDDPAAQYLIMPYLRDAAIPVVFCGLNWDASAYGLPYRNTTGMVEVSPIPQILRLLRRHARGPRLGFLAEDTEVKRKELIYHERLFGITYDKIYFVTSHAAWKEAFLHAQKEVDMLMILGGRIAGLEFSRRYALRGGEERDPKRDGFRMAYGSQPYRRGEEPAGARALGRPGDASHSRRRPAQ